MAFLLDDIVESALGPWGLVLGLGVGALVASRKRIRPLGASALGAMAPLRATAAAGVAGATGAVNRVRATSLRDTGQAVFLGISRSWTELYAEARAEFEATHPSTSGSTEFTQDIVRPESGLRDAHGRFIKRTAGGLS